MYGRICTSHSLLHPCSTLNVHALLTEFSFPKPHWPQVWHACTKTHTLPSNPTPQALIHLAGLPLSFLTFSPRAALSANCEPARIRLGAEPPHPNLASTQSKYSENHRESGLPRPPSLSSPATASLKVSALTSAASHQNSDLPAFEIPSRTHSRKSFLAK